ncbi:MAG: LysM peptidoglycan-binding domain-containing protein, partial [Verrucomicrobiota bacterium]
MKMKLRFASLLATLLASAPLLSASEVERLRALVAEQEMQIQQLELKVAQLTNSPTPVSVPATPPAATKAISEDGLVPVAETCPEPSSKENPGTYTVKAGDNMVIIARKHGTTSATLNKLNGLKSDGIIRPGQKLKVPAPTTTASTEAEQPPTPEPVAAPEPTLAPAAPASSTVKHTVADKETFYSIAKIHNVTVAALTKENPSINPKTLRIGQIVQIPGKSETTNLSPVPSPEQSLSLSSQSNIPVSSQSSTASQSRAADKPVKITK